MRLYKKVSKSRETFKVRDFVNTSQATQNSGYGPTQLKANAMLLSVDPSNIQWMYELIQLAFALKSLF